MNLRFWRKSTTPADGVQEESGDEPASRSPAAREPGHRRVSGDSDGETAVVPRPARPNRRLLMGASIVVLAVAAIGVVSWKTFLPASGPRTDALDSPAPIKPGAYPIRKLKIPSPAEFLEARRARSKKPQAGAAALAMQGNELPSTEAATGKPSPVENQAGAGRQPEIETPSKDNDNIQVQTGTPGTELPQDENPPGENRLAEIDNPKSSNDTMQTQVAALRKEKETNPSAPPPVRAVDGTSAAVFGGEIAIGTRDTQGVAITLKEAIEAMNTSARKPVGKASR